METVGCLMIGRIVRVTRFQLLLSLMGMMGRILSVSFVRWFGPDSDIHVVLKSNPPEFRDGVFSLLGQFGFRLLSCYPCLDRDSRKIEQNRRNQGQGAGRPLVDCPAVGV